MNFLDGWDEIVNEKQGSKRRIRRGGKKSSSPKRLGYPPTPP